MIYTTQDFYNKVATELRVKFFKEENHGYTQNTDYHKTTHTLELFNNGCLTYRQLIGRLAKSCNQSTKNIHSIVDNYVVSFGQYKYKPRK
jgi:hypothetical protein